MKRREIPFGRPWISQSDKDAVLRVLDGTTLTHGPEGKSFEREFERLFPSGVHAVTMSSCMAALHLAYQCMGVGPGDEVIVPALTHVAAVHAVEWVGARPIFVDCNPNDGNIAIHSIKQAITERTKIISLVHFAGIPCDMDSILTIAQAHNLRIIEDCAISLGATWANTHVGALGDAGCFSFYPVKHITTAEGGMFVSKHAELAERVARVRAFGVDRTHTERTIPGMYDVPMLGLNYRMSELQAALGRSQLERLSTNIVEREKNFRNLQSRLRDIPNTHILDSEHEKGRNSYYCLIIRFDKRTPEYRNCIVKKLNERGVGTSVYYPQPIPRMTYYRNKYAENVNQFPGAVAISDGSIALPVGHHITDEDIDYIVNSLRESIKEAEHV